MVKRIRGKSRKLSKNIKDKNGQIWRKIWKRGQNIIARCLIKRKIKRETNYEKMYVLKKKQRKKLNRKKRRKRWTFQKQEERAEKIISKLGSKAVIYIYGRAQQEETVPKDWQQNETAATVCFKIYTIVKMKAIAGLGYNGGNEWISHPKFVWA